MQVQGRDRETECYRVTVDVDGAAVAAWVPERLATGQAIIGSRPTHQEAYVWIAAHRQKIEAAIAQLARGGRRPKAPYDQITLIKDR